MRPDLQLAFVRGELVQWLRWFEPGGDRLAPGDLDSLGATVGTLLGRGGGGGRLCLRAEERGERWGFNAGFPGLFDLFLVVEHLVVKLVGVHLHAFFFVVIRAEGGGIP